ncbi:MAG: hypothetical protein MRQ09_04865 [Candidatus Midichloria sp.]|nr:hypothetical protein [Candidatus Midichloria sp.]
MKFATQALVQRKRANTNYDQRYLINNPSLMKETACSVFGDINVKLSKGDQLRFGSRGNIAVNLNTGMW